jgi:8-oxo-dGTP diphosphatase
MKRPAKKAPERDSEEERFLEKYEAGAYARPSVTVDLVILTVLDNDLKVLLVQRNEHPFKGRWALPGGFVRVSDDRKDQGEDLDAAARRELEEETGLSKETAGDFFLEQVKTFGRPGRDPRMRVISVAYYALVDRGRFEGALDGASLRVARVDVPWEGETGGAVDVHVDDPRAGALASPLATLAFDHADILGTAVKRIRGKLDYSPIGFQLLPSTFTLLDLQRVHETVLGRPLNKDSFRRRMLASGQLEATGETEQAVGHRPAELYRFVKRSAV